MSLRGFFVDRSRRDYLSTQTAMAYHKVEQWINQLSYAIQDQPLNPRSGAPIMELLYEKMGLPVQYKERANGEKIPSVDREALEKLTELHFDALPLHTALLKLRDLDKQLQVLKSGIDSDGRMRFSFNVTGTESGRWSGSKNAFGGGTNFQNLNQDMRVMLVADPGWKLCTVDLSQAESYAVAFYSDDRNYIEACLSGDLHTYTARLVWPKLKWHGDLKKDKEISSQPHYRHFSKRDLAKRGGHLTNYLGTHWQMARSLKLPTKVAEEFQDTYFATFPGIPRWHHEVARQLKSTGSLTTVLGRRRQFLDRPDSNSTLREAVAFIPQSTVVEIVNLALYRLWRKYDLGEHRIQILGEVHDEIVLQYRETDHEFPEIAGKAMEIPVRFPTGKVMTIPAECAVGYVWNKKYLAPPGSPQERAQTRPEVDVVLAGPPIVRVRLRMRPLQI